MTDPNLGKLDQAALAQRMQMEAALGRAPEMKAIMDRIESRGAAMQAAGGDAERLRELAAEQQADMLALQAAMARHGEAMEMMSSYIRKMQESQAAIIRNMG